MLDQAISQLPAAVALGHRAGDDAAVVERDVVVRADSAGCTEGFLTACRARNIGFYVNATSKNQVTEAIFDAEGITQVWLAALDRSWLNQIEIVFSILQRKVIKPANLDQLASQVLEFEARYNTTAAPFDWRFTRTDLHALCDRIKAHENLAAA